MRVPLPHIAVGWQTDEHGRRTAPIPAFGQIVELSPEECARARAAIAANGKNPIPLVFEIEFLGGHKALYMAASEAHLVEK
jgi:hypothetical protein